MEVVFTKEMPDMFQEDKINAFYGDVMHLINMRIDIEGIIYDENWTVKRFLNGFRLKLNKRIESVFNYLELDINLLDYKICELSKTNFKFVLLAYLLLNNIKVIVFDYFDVGLSYKDRKKLYRIMKNMKKDGMSIIYISKDLPYMSQFCDNITVMSDGEIVFNGDINELYKHQDILSDIPDIYEFVKIANEKGARLDYTLDSKELLKDIYRSVY